MKFSTHPLALKTAFHQLLEDKPCFQEHYEAWLLTQAYHQAVGKYVSFHTQKIAFREGHLVLYIPEAPLRHELSMQRASIEKQLRSSLQENPLVHPTFRGIRIRANQ